MSLAPLNPQVTEILICPKALQLTESCSTETSDILLKMKGNSFPPLYLTFLLGGMRGRGVSRVKE